MQEWEVYEHKQVEKEFAPASSNQVLGNISWVESSGKKAIIYLLNAHLNPESTLVARNKDGDPTALLNPSSYRKGRALGATIAYGKPNIDDEVILRESAALPEGWDSQKPATTAGPKKTRFPFIIPEKAKTASASKKEEPKKATPTQPSSLPKGSRLPFLEKPRTSSKVLE